MYQVLINDKYYVSDVDASRHIDLTMIVYGFESTSNKYKAMFFEYESEAKSIAEQVGGKVIEYVEKKGVVGLEVGLEEVCKKIEKWKKFGVSVNE